MSRYKIGDSVVDTQKASAEWKELKEFNGSNHIPVHSGSQYEHQRLYRSRKGRYYIEHFSNWQGSADHAEWISPEGAARWLLLNEDEIPGDLLEYIDNVSE